MKRVVQIGFHRCGTRSLARLFAQSGYEAAHWRVQRKNGKLNLARTMKKNIAAGRKPLHRMERYAFLSDLECFDDGQIWSGFLRFREIDAAYPDTQFLLNTRDKEGWLQSRLTHRQYAQKVIAARGLSGIDSLLQVWSDDWDRHLADVRHYFRDREHDLVEFNIDTDGINDLIVQLPDFALDAAHWDHIGKSNPDNVARNRAALDAFVNERPDLKSG